MVFFENHVCVNCNHPLGFDPAAMTMVALLPYGQPDPENTRPPAVTPSPGGHAPAQPAGNAAASPPPPPPLWNTAIGPEHDNSRLLPLGPFRFCKNHTDHQACNFLLAADSPEQYCVSCRQTKVIPNLSAADNLQAWVNINTAQRRLYYTLAKLWLENAPVTPVYQFLEDTPGQEPVMTGHADGLITLNIAEADDAERTQRRLDLHEPYRTLLGHLRHEIGHFYWDQFFLQDEEALAAFRELFGDERDDYAQALKRHYDSPNDDWQGAYISNYAASHPWEDWAETWAHYLHLVDLLETAANYRLCFATRGAPGVSNTCVQDPFAFFDNGAHNGPTQDISGILNEGMSLTLVLNSLNRSLGQDDAYPFSIPTPVLEKLGFVHNSVRRFVARQEQPAMAG